MTRMSFTMTTVNDIQGQLAQLLRDVVDGELCQALQAADAALDAAYSRAHELDADMREMEG